MPLAAVSRHVMLRAKPEASPDQPTLRVVRFFACAPLRLRMTFLNNRKTLKRTERAATVDGGKAFSDREKNISRRGRSVRDLSAIGLNRQIAWSWGASASGATVVNIFA